MREYTCSFGAGQRTFSWALAAGVGFIMIMLLNLQQMAGTLLLLGAAGALIGLGFNYMYAARSVTVDDDAITFKRDIGVVVLNFSDIVSITDDPTLRMRYAKSGFFLLRKDGSFFGKGTRGYTYFYCTQPKNIILITKKDNSSIVITPDDPQSFMEDIRSMYPKKVIHN